MPNLHVEFDIDGTTAETVREELGNWGSGLSNLRVVEVSDYDPKYTTYGGLDPKVVIKHG